MLKIKLFLRSLLFSIGMNIATVLHASLSLCLFWLPRKKRYRFITLWSRFIVWWLKITCRVHYQVHGLEHIPKQNAIILCKHQSTWETLALQIIFPMQTWVIKRELLNIPFFGWALRLLNPIAIDRSSGTSALNQLIRQGTKRLQQGYWIIIFPEGSRAAPGEKLKFNAGGALLAAKSGYPVVPITHNAGEFWPKGGFLKRPGTIHLYIGPAINTVDRDAKEINKLAEAWITASHQS